MPRISCPKSPKKIKRVFPRIDDSTYKKIQAIARKRGQNLSELTRDLYADLIEKEDFQYKKPAA